MVRMIVEMRGAARYQTVLREAARRGDDLTPLMDSIGTGLVSSTIERFNETSLAPDGTPWPPSLAALEEGRRTLVKRHNLRDSITHEPSRDSVEVGSDGSGGTRDYAAVHQFGKMIRAKSPRGLRFRIGDQFVTKAQVTIPARPFLGVSNDDEEMILAEATDWLKGAFVS